MAVWKNWEDLTIADDYMFKLVMSHKHICKHLLEMILGIKIRELREPETEKPVKSSYDSKGIRLDVYVEDDANTVYDIEMQMRQYTDEVLGHRTRYYQSVIDFDALQRGARYDRLKISIIIFICPFRLFGNDRHIYTFKSTCQEDTSILLDDGTSKIFLSTKGTMDDVSTEVRNFLDFVDGLPVKSDFVDEVRDLITNLKNTEKEKVNYMTFQMKIDEERAEARAEGHAEGKAEGRAEGKAEGLAEGEARGRTQGESRLSQLISLLLRSGKTDEIVAATESEAARNELYARYGIA